MPRPQQAFLPRAGACSSRPARIKNSDLLQPDTPACISANGMAKQMLSALPPKADIERHDWHVRLVPASPECKSGSGSIEGPALCERSDDVIEGPGRGVLMRDVIHLVGDGVRMCEIIVALI